MSKEDKQETTPSSVVLPPDFDMSEEELFLLQKTYDPRLYLSPDALRLVQAQPSADTAPIPSVVQSISTPPCPFQVWRTIQLGTAKSVQELAAAIKVSGCRISTWALDISSKVTLTTDLTNVELIRVTLKELGFSTNATHQQIYQRALQLGLALCPAEVGFQLRLQYLDQKVREWLFIAMESISSSDNNLNVFAVGRDDDKPWVDACYNAPERLWDQDGTWIFARPRPASSAHPLIDCNAAPWCPDGWTVEEHRKGGQLEFDPAKIALFLDDGQKNGHFITGHKLRQKLAGKPVLNACVLDYLLAHTKLIPVTWKQDDRGRTRCIFFWDTIYCDSSGDLCVRYLYWHDGEWDWYCYWLGNGFGDQSCAAVSASS